MVSHLDNTGMFGSVERSATLVSPAQARYAAIIDIPICIAIQRFVVPPSQVLLTMVGMWIA
jgi:hypothetical protein